MAWFSATATTRSPTCAASASARSKARVSAAVATRGSGSRTPQHAPTWLSEGQIWPPAPAGCSSRRVRLRVQVAEHWLHADHALARQSALAAQRPLWHRPLRTAVQLVPSARRVGTQVPSAPHTSVPGSMHSAWSKPPAERVHVLVPGEQAVAHASEAQLSLRSSSKPSDAHMAPPLTASVQRRVAVRRPPAVPQLLPLQADQADQSEQAQSRGQGAAVQLWLSTLSSPSASQVRPPLAAGVHVRARIRTPG